MLKTSFPFLLACSLVACGDDGNSTPDASPDGETAQPRAVVVAGTFMAGTAGVMSKLELDTLAVEQRVAPTAAVGSDPMMRKFGDELFVVNRADGNNVTILDARTFAVVEQLATGANSNAQDVAVVGDQLFVPAFGTAGVVVLTRGTTQTSTIDLSALDPDGKPDCVSAYAVGNQVFVACEMLDQTFIPRGRGKVAVIDASTHAVTTTLTLTYPNPFGVFEQLPAELGGQLVIPTVPSFADATMGCVEQITPGPTPAVEPCLVTHQALGGYVARLDSQGTTMVGSTTVAPISWMVVTNGQFGADARNRVRGFDHGTNTLFAEPSTPEAQVLVDLAVCPNTHLVVADQTMAANGLRVYLGNIERTSAALPIGLRPGSSHGLACY